MDIENKSSQELRKEIQTLNRKVEDLESIKAKQEQMEKILQLVHVLSDLIAKNQDFHSSLSAALGKICEAAGLIFSQIWFPEPDGKHLRCSQMWHSQSSEHQKFREMARTIRIASGEGLIGKVFELKSPLWISDVANDKNFLQGESATSAGLKSAFAIPILANGEALAVLEFFSDETRSQDRELMHLVSGYAAQLGLLLQRYEAEKTLKQHEEEYRILFENNPSPMWVHDKNSETILAVNDSAVSHYGYSREEFLSMTLKDISISEEGQGAGILKHRRRNDPPISVEMTCRDLIFGGKEARLVLINDVTKRQLAEETVKYQAYHDALTSLPNRLLFNDRLQIGLAKAHRGGGVLAILFLDLDRFKNINDTLGHPVGDELLQQVATRLKNCLREEDSLARFGGDEFVILLSEIARIRDAARVAQKILDVFKEPWPIEEHQLYMTTSIGIAIYPYDGEDTQTLLRNADTAMYRAKDSGRNNYQLYTPTMNVKAFEHLMLENRLRHALEHEELVLHYQPQINIHTGEMIGMEALLRWQHPGLGLLAPDKFLFLAEESGLIIPIGEWVLRAACAQNKKWQDAGYPPLNVSVNLAPRQFQQRSLIRTIKRILKESGLRPQCLGLEITEGIAMEDADLTIHVLRELNKLGIELSIDDFGTGYSSLSYLKKFPIHRLKIAQPFVQDLVNDPNDAAIATSVIVLARNLRIKAMAEGVETPEQLIFLQEKECDEAQGYLFSKPLPSDDFEKLLLELKKSN